MLNKIVSVTHSVYRGHCVASFLLLSSIAALCAFVGVVTGEIPSIGSAFGSGAAEFCTLVLLALGGAGFVQLWRTQIGGTVFTLSVLVYAACFVAINWYCQNAIASIDAHWKVVASEVLRQGEPNSDQKISVRGSTLRAASPCEIADWRESLVRGGFFGSATCTNAPHIIMFSLWLDETRTRGTLLIARQP